MAVLPLAKYLMVAKRLSTFVFEVPVYYKKTVENHEHDPHSYLAIGST
jgi:hypothetical protein